MVRRWLTLVPALIALSCFDEQGEPEPSSKAREPELESSAASASPAPSAPATSAPAASVSPSASLSASPGVTAADVPVTTDGGADEPASEGVPLPDPCVEHVVPLGVGDKTLDGILISDLLRVYERTLRAPLLWDEGPHKGELTEIEFQLELTSAERLAELGLTEYAPIEEVRSEPAPEYPNEHCGHIVSLWLSASVRTLDGAFEATGLVNHTTPSPEWYFSFNSSWDTTASDEPSAVGAHTGLQLDIANGRPIGFFSAGSHRGIFPADGCYDIVGRRIDLDESLVSLDGGTFRQLLEQIRSDLDDAGPAPAVWYDGSTTEVRIDVEVPELVCGIDSFSTFQAPGLVRMTSADGRIATAPFDTSIYLAEDHRVDWLWMQRPAWVEEYPYSAETMRKVFGFVGNEEDYFVSTHSQVLWRSGSAQFEGYMGYAISATTPELLEWCTGSCSPELEDAIAYDRLSKALP